MKKSTILIFFVSFFYIGQPSSTPANAAFWIDAGPAGTNPLGNGKKGVYFYNTTAALTDCSQFTAITGRTEQFSPLYKAEEKNKKGGLLQGPFSSDIPNNTFLLGNKSASLVTDHTQPLYPVVKEGNGAPNQYVIDLRTVYNPAPVNGLDKITDVNFWAGKGVAGNISHISLWDSIGTTAQAAQAAQAAHTTPEPASVALVGLGVFCFACGPLRRRMRKTAGVAQAA